VHLTGDSSERGIAKKQTLNNKNQIVGRTNMSAETFVRRRFVRLSLAAILIGAAIWTFSPYVTHRVAVSAFVNSQLLRVTAPFSGQVSQMMPRKGAFLDAAQSLTIVEPLSPDKRHLQDLELQFALAKGAGELAQQQLKEIATLDEEFGERIEAYQHARVEQIDHEAKEAEAEHAGCVAELRQRHDVVSRFGELAEYGLASQIRSAEAQALQQVTSTRCDIMQARMSRIQVELDAARKGLFLRDGSSDVPYSQQQRDRLILRRQELEALALQEKARSSQLTADINAERERTTHLDNYQVVLPAGYVVWSTAASPGSSVTEGQTILDLADCAHRFVAVEIPERDFEQISTGEKVAVRLLGSDEWRQGRVQQIRGSAARADDLLLAAQIPSYGPGTITVEVSLPPDDAQTDKANFCGIGRLAEVRIRRPLFDFASRAMTKLFGGRQPERSGTDVAGGE
jgi:multidrug resistance efflux pump